MRPALQGKVNPEGPCYFLETTVLRSDIGQRSNL